MQVDRCSECQIAPETLYHAAAFNPDRRSQLICAALVALACQDARSTLLQPLPQPYLWREGVDFVQEILPFAQRFVNAHADLRIKTAMTSDVQQTPFVKQLAAGDRPTRDAALQSLKTYLRGRHDLTPLSLLKLWKGLFYSMWHCDRPLPQQSLASELATLPALCPADLRIPFLRAFWLTMARDWTTIDVLRMEKFLLLTRRYVGAMFVLIRDAAWREETMREMLELLEEVPLNVQDPKIPNGMRYHVIDIYVDELERLGVVSEEEDTSDAKGPLETLLQPLRRLAKDSPTKDVRRKCREALEDGRLPGNKKAYEEKANTEEDDDEWGGIED